MKTVDFLDAVKASYGLTSDYQLAKKLAISTSRITNYRVAANFMDDAMCLKIADLLEIDALFVVASVNIERHERSNHPEMVKFWLGVVQQGGLNPVNFATSAA